MEQKYQIIRKIGQGQHGSVYLVQKISQQQKNKKKNNSSNEEELYAMKKIPISKNSFDFQAKLLLSLNHPNVISVKEVFQDKDFLIIILQLAEEGDLHQYIKRNFHKNVPENLILSWICQLCLGLYYLHQENNVIHRDIKTRNILVKENGLLKLGDFGVARKLQKGEDFANTSVGTPCYLAPQSINFGKYDNRSDIWCLGCVIYQICTGQKPFIGQSLGVLLNNIVNNQFGEIPIKYSKDLRQLVNSLLQKDPLKRPTIITLLQTPLIKRQFKKLKQAYDQLERLIYPQECPKTTKYLDIEDKKVNSFKMFSESLKTTKNQKYNRLEIEEKKIEQKNSGSQDSCKKEKIQKQKCFSTSEFILPPKVQKSGQNNRIAQKRNINFSIEIKKSDYLNNITQKNQKKDLFNYPQSLGKLNHITQGTIQPNRKVQRQKFLDKSLKSIIANRTKEKDQTNSKTN